jgi:folate-binding protein YgfZ
MSLTAVDVSGWGYFRFLGRDAVGFLQGLVTADLARLSPREALPSCVLTAKGGLVADCELYGESETSVLAVTRPAAADGFARVFEGKIMLSESVFKRLSPQAWLVVGDDAGPGLSWPRLGQPARLILGADPPPEARLMTPEELDFLRVAAGFPWYGADLDEKVLPLEARQDDAVSLDKGCYLGQETVSRLARVGHVNRLLCGLSFPSGAPAPGTVLTRGGRETGRVTSAVRAIGLGFARVADSVPGTALDAGGVPVLVREMPGWPKPLGVR